MENFTHCIVFYDKRRLKISDREFHGVEDAMMNLENKVIKLRGSIYAIADMKFVGRIEDAPKFIDPDYVPAGQRTIDGGLLPFNASKFLESGEMELKGNGLIWGKYTQEQFKALAKKQWDEFQERNSLLT